MSIEFDFKSAKEQKDVDYFMLHEGCSLLVDGLASRYEGWEGASQFNGTVERLVNLYNELCWPMERIEKELDKVFKVFDEVFDEMLTAGPFYVYILCPHHLLPCRLRLYISYVPSGDKVIGLSKIYRVAEVMAKRPILQERYCQEVADVFMKKLNPKGVAVSASGEHSCMGSRGIRQFIPIVVNVVRGVYFESATARSEFLALVQRGGSH